MWLSHEAANTVLDIALLVFEHSPFQSLHGNDGAATWAVQPFKMILAAEAEKLQIEFNREITDLALIFQAVSGHGYPR
jgi:hypothetical protein